MGEYLPSDVNLDYIKERGNVVTSNNQITFTHKKVDNKIIIDFVNNYDNTILELPLLYYKGYGAKINDEYLDVFKTNNGLVGVKLNNIKEGTLEVSYIKTPTIYISRGISLLSVTIFGLYLYMKGRKRMKTKIFSYFLAFIIPMLIMVLLYMIVGIYPLK